ncbi:hypothetical protein M569_04621, partial [Genlisea aurea]
WEPPLNGSYKVNVDSGRAGNRTVWAGILRDCRGTCIGWFTKSMSPFLEPEHGEYLAARAGLQFAAFLGLSSVTLESDCLALV